MTHPGDHRGQRRFTLRRRALRVFFAEVEAMRPIAGRWAIGKTHVALQQVAEARAIPAAPDLAVGLDLDQFLSRRAQPAVIFRMLLEMVPAQGRVDGGTLAAMAEQPRVRALGLQRIAAEKLALTLLVALRIAAAIAA